MNKLTYSIKFITIEPENNSKLETKSIIHNKKSRRNKIKEVWDEENYEDKTILWRLRRYTGDFIYNGIDWQYQSSSKELNYEGLKTTNVFLLLNKENVFDFDYLPKENDMIWMHLEYTNKQYRLKLDHHFGLLSLFYIKIINGLSIKALITFIIILRNIKMEL